MKNKDIDKAAREYADQYKQYGGSEYEARDMENEFIDGFTAGAQSRQSEIDELVEALEEATSWVNPRAKKPKKDVSVLIQYVDGIELGCYCGYGEWHCPNSYYSPVDKPIGWRPIDTPKATQLLEKYGKKAESVKPKE